MFRILKDGKPYGIYESAVEATEALAVEYDEGLAHGGEEWKCINVELIGKVPPEIQHKNERFPDNEVTPFDLSKFVDEVISPVNALDTGITWEERMQRTDREVLWTIVPPSWKWCIETAKKLELVSAWFIQQISEERIMKNLKAKYETTHQDIAAKIVLPTEYGCNWSQIAGIDAASHRIAIETMTEELHDTGYSDPAENDEYAVCLDWVSELCATLHWFAMTAWANKSMIELCRELSVIANAVTMESEIKYPL
jgi:hypothetical protein